ncbi:hypothetical protein GF373_17100, partial [bacterium]|nr:hypothetical protein [bacterium]
MKLSRLITIFLFLVGLVVLYRVSCYVPPIMEGEIAAWDRDGVLEGVEIQNGKWKRVYSSEYKKYKVGNQQKGRIVRSNDLHLSGTI